MQMIKTTQKDTRIHSTRSCRFSLALSLHLGLFAASVRVASLYALSLASTADYSLNCGFYSVYATQNRTQR